MFPGSRTSVVTLALLAALSAALTGCGSDTESTASDPSADTSTAPASESASPSAPASASPSPSATLSLPSTTEATEAVQLPTCESVWVEGQKFPRRYEGCLEGSETIQADGLYCEFGKPLFSYAQHYYAVQGGPVNRTDQTLAQDPAFQTAQRKCGG